LTGACASLLVVAGGSVLAGQAVLSLCGRREAWWVAGPVGLAALLTAAGVAVWLPGDVTAVVVAVAVLLGASTAVLAARRPTGLAGIGPAIPSAALAALAASLPFAAAGMVGVLGVGLVNDDMASHLLMASWLEQRFTPEPVLIDQGYPLGPHALAAGLAKALGTGPVEAFAGLTLAVPALTAMLAFGALDRLTPVWRTLVAAMAAVPYLITAYLAQEAFKEPVMALLVLGFALWLSRVERPRDGVPLGLLAAGAVYVYSFPGLAWLAGAALAWGASELLRRPDARRSAGSVLRRAAMPAAAAAVVALVLVAPDLDRVREFTDFRALDPDRANEGGLGNLRGHISPLEALGIWPTSEFRLSAGAGALPALAFYAGAALALLALALGLPAWIRRNGPAVPAALAAALIIYIGARAFGTVYTSAKALAIAAPLITLIALGGLLGRRGDARREGWGGVRTGEHCPRQAAHAPPSARTVRRNAYRPALAALVLLGMALSSFLVLRQAPVGPTAHGDELAEIRPIVEGERVLFLGRDNFVLYHLRGSRPFTHVRNFYDPYFVKPNFELRAVGSKFGFDALEARKLARFPYVITTRAAYASGPPPGYRAELETDSYVLWRAGNAAGSRRPAEAGPAPTGPIRCRSGDRAKGTAALAPRGTARAGAAAWSPSATVESGAPATARLRLPRGRWHLSLQYDATRPVSLSAAGFEAELPGNLDYRGVGPYWAAGTLEVERGGSVRVRARVEPPPAAGRLLGAESVAHLGAIVATSATGGYVEGAEPPYPGAGERLGLAACGTLADWIAARPR